MTQSHKGQVTGTNSHYVRGMVPVLAKKALEDLRPKQIWMAGHSRDRASEAMPWTLPLTCGSNIQPPVFALEGNYFPLP